MSDVRTVENKLDLLTRVKQVTGLDRAIVFSILARGWSTCAGLVSVFLVVHFLSAGQQGYYYTFSSLVAAQIIFELGFSFVILQLTAHERASLTIHPDGTIEGELAPYSRLASILQTAVRWYSVAALIMTATLLAGGFFFFARQHSQLHIGWKLPWLLAVLASCFSFQIDPVLSFLEGCGRVVQVGKLRAAQAVCGSALAWTAMILHHGLYAPGLVITGQVATGLYFLYRNSSLLLPLYRFRVKEHAVRWSTEIWPFQWRIALSWASSYLTMQVMNPILFAFAGPAAAGRMGMSLSICNSISGLALAWMTTKASPFGALVALRKYAELDRLFFRALWQSTALLLLALGALLGGLPLIFHFYPRLAARVLPLPLLALLLLTLICTHLVVSEAYYLRAHKKEPFALFWVLIALISIGSMAAFASYWGALGITLSYFLCGGVLRLIAATYLLVKKRREWHTAAPPIPARL